MNAVVTDIAEAVKTLVNGGTYDQSFTATRVHLPVYDSTKTPELVVFVIPAQQAVNLATGSRAYSDDTYTISVSFLKTVSRDANGQPDGTEMDANLFLVQQVMDRLKSNERLPTYADAALIGVENKRVYDPDALDQTDVFLSIVFATYKLFR